MKHRITTLLLLVGCPSIAAAQLHGIARGKLESVMRFEIAGVVSDVHVLEGQRVAAGEPLISLHDEVANAAWRAARAQAAKQGAVESATVELNLVTRQFKRLQQAFQEQASSEFELEEKRSQLDQARAALTVAEEEANAAQATMELRAAELQKFHLQAPFDGQVVRIDRKLGQPIDPSETAIMIVDARYLEIEMFLPVNLFNQFVVGEQYTMQADAPVSRSIQVTASYVSPIIDSTSGTFRCVFDFDNSQQKLPAGFAVRLKTND